MARLGSLALAHALFIGVAGGLFATTVAPTTAMAADPVERGRALAEKHCARCHVVGAYNRLGGIGSTLSFKGLLALPDAMERMETFYARRPHPAFMRVEGVDRWTDLPSTTAEVKMNRRDIEDVVAFSRALAKENEKRAKK